MPIAKKDIPEFVRRCYESYQSATYDLRQASEESRKMWLGGRHQWRDGEISNRLGNNRPWVTINRCKPACDQVENEARNNPPGPEIHPVGGGADKDGAQIQEGLIREYEYRSNAQGAYVTALKYAAAGNYGAFELATEYAGERTMDQRIVVKEIEDPDCVFVDPDARMACREDAMWGGKIRVLTRDKLTEEFGTNLKILNRGLVERSAGWMQSALGWRGNQATVNLWTGGARSCGPYYVCEFYKVEIEREKLRLHSDNILRFEGEEPPEGVSVQEDEDGAIERWAPHRKITKYIVTALDVIDETEWLGDAIPIFWVMGPEMYLKGKLYRLSLIDGATDAQRLLNYTATSAAEVVNGMTKAPWVGPVGTFDVTNAQGMNPWESSNTQMWAYIEYKPVFGVDPATGMTQLAPPPQRNTWEAPIQTLMELATFCIEAIKGATSVFFDPSVQSAADAQSGEAIKALQSQTNIGTLNWQDNLHRAVALSYRQAGMIFKKILSGPRVAAICRPDTQHEMVEINREFPGGVDPKTGKPGKRNNITQGDYAYRVTAGPNFRTRTEQAVENFMEVLKIAPQITQAPGILAQVVRMVGEGNPEMEQMADALLPGGGQDGEQTPQQLQQKLVASAQQIQQLTQLVQQMHQAIQAKLPQVEAQKWKAALDAVTKIRVAEITASKDADNAQADREASQLETILGMAHDVSLAAMQQDHEQGMADQAHANATDMATTQAALQPPPQEAGPQ